MTLPCCFSLLKLILFWVFAHKKISLQCLWNQKTCIILVEEHWHLPFLQFLTIELILVEPSLLFSTPKIQNLFRMFRQDVASRSALKPAAHLTIKLCETCVNLNFTLPEHKPARCSLPSGLSPSFKTVPANALIKKLLTQTVSLSHQHRLWNTKHLHVEGHFFLFFLPLITAPQSVL